MFFCLFAAFTIYLGWLDGQAPASDGNWWTGPLCLLILLGSVLVHELGHLLVTRRLGGNLEELVLGPLGGLGTGPLGLEPTAELVAVLAGPLVNLAICFASALLLAGQGGVSLMGLMNPVAPAQIIEGEFWLVALKMLFWINWSLIVVNLIPAYPFDGGRGLRAGLLVAVPTLDTRQAVAIAAHVAKLTAIALLVAAWLVRDQNASYLIQSWFALVLLAIFVFFSARKEEAISEMSGAEEAFLGYDFSAGYSSLERSGPGCSMQTQPGPVVRWWKQRRQRREQRRRERESLEDRLVDEILQRVHREGVESLTRQEQTLLRRASARYRTRQQ